MACVKTAISVEESLFKEVDALAREMKLSRSKVFALGARQLVQKHKMEDMIRRISEAYADAPDEEERAFLRFTEAQLAESTRAEE